MRKRITIRGKVDVSKTCPNRGDQITTLKSDICGSKGRMLPVYSCSIHGQCTRNKVCHLQDPSIQICIGCPDGPWS